MRRPNSDENLHGNYYRTVPVYRYTVRLCNVVTVLLLLVVISDHVTRPKNNLAVFSTTWPFFWLLALTAVVIFLDGHISINTSSWIDWRVVYIRHSINPHTNTRKHCNSVFVTLLKFYFAWDLTAVVDSNFSTAVKSQAKIKFQKRHKYRITMFPCICMWIYRMPYVNHSPIDPTLSIDGDMAI